MLVRRIARAALAAYFINESVKSFTKTQQQAEEAKPFVDFLNHTSGGKVPNNPALVVRGQGALMGCVGTALALGKLPRLSAALLVPTVGVNAYVHEAFWAETDPTEKTRKQANFLKTVSIAGGVLLAAADTAGKPGLAWRAQHGATVTRREAVRAAKTARREAKLLAAQASNALPS